MNFLRSHVARLSTRRLVATLALIGVGALAIAYFGSRTMVSFRELGYIREQGLDRGVASVDAIRPWMTIRFVAVAYAVPEEYLYSALGVEFDRRHADDTLGQLNRELGLDAPRDERGRPRPVIVDQAQAAVEAYRADPVATGLRDVRPWMSVRYIANSTGVPEGFILEQLGLAGDEEAGAMPLDVLGGERRIEGGPQALVDDIQRALDAYQPQP